MKINRKNIIPISIGIAITVVLSLLIAACSSKSPTSSSPKLSSIDVKPFPVNSSVGLTTQFTATGIYSDGKAADITSQVTWASSDTDVVTISSSGLASSIAIGSTHITASFSGITSQAVIMPVTGPILSSIVIDPSIPLKLVEGSTQQFTAIGTYSDGKTVDITSQVTWTRSNVTTVTVSPDGLATATGTGTTSISANLSGLMSQSATITVEPPTLILESIEIIPSTPAKLAIGASQQFMATGNYSDGSTEDITDSVTWTSDTPIAATITSTGLVKGVAAGTADFTAAMFGVTSQPVVLTVVTTTTP